MAEEKRYVVFEPEDRVRMNQYAIDRLGGPPLSGVVIGYGTFKGHPGFLKVRHDDSGEIHLYAPWFWARESDGAHGKSPEADDPANRVNAKPITTRYSGYQFRSRAEARWGVFFDALHLEWEYEKEGYTLPSGPYLPDFWLPQVSMWAEIKPTKFSGKEQQKCFELATLTGYECLMLDGAPVHKPYYSAKPVEDPANVVHECGLYMLTNHHNYVLHEGRFYANPAEGEIFRDTLDAVQAARSARFEHGESGMSVEDAVKLRR